MRSSSRWTRRFRRDPESGATAALVGILVATFVLTGMLALAVEGGNVMYERRQVQNGADAAVLALAQNCAESNADCAPADAQTQAYANSNAYDGETRITQECGQGVAGFASCGSGSVANLGQCPPPPSWVTDNGYPYVEVHTASKSPGNPSGMKTWLTRLFSGGGPSNVDVPACARAAWGPLGTHDAVTPLVISTCEWGLSSQGGHNYYNRPDEIWPGYGAGHAVRWPDPSGPEEVTILMEYNSKDYADALPCSNFNGHDFPGGFGFIDNTNCQATVTNGDWVQVKDGKGLVSTCDLTKYLGTVITIPVYDCFAIGTVSSPPSVCYSDSGGGGAKTWYHIVDWAKFYLRAFVVNGTLYGDAEGATAPGDPGTLSRDEICGTTSGVNRACVRGWFVEGTENGDLGGGGGHGVSAVQPAG